MARHQTSYRCYHCRATIHRILNTGPERWLWCARCACNRRFVLAAARERITATAWPPPLREEGA